MRVVLALLASAFLAVAAPAPAVQAQAGLSRDYLAEYLTCDRFAMPRERLACFEAILKLYKLETGRLSGTPDDLVAAERATPALPPGAGAAAGSGMRPSSGSAGVPTAAVVSRGTQVEIRRHATVDDLPLPFETTVTAFNMNRRGDFRFRIAEGWVFERAYGPDVKESLLGKKITLKKNLFGNWRAVVEGQTKPIWIRPVQTK